MNIVTSDRGHTLAKSLFSSFLFSLIFSILDLVFGPFLVSLLPLVLTTRFANEEMKQSDGRCICRIILSSRPPFRCADEFGLTRGFERN